MRSISTAWVLALLSSFIPVGIEAAEPQPPDFRNLRYEEDINLYRGLTADGLADEMKFISLSDDGRVFVSFGGQARLRWEFWENFNFEPDADDDFYLLRLRAHADLRAGDHVRVFIEGRYAAAGDRDLPGGRRTLDADDPDLQNAFVDLLQTFTEWDATLRLGRQELSFGAQRLVSPLDWSNTRRTWDGARVILVRDNWRIDAFATRPVAIDQHDINEADDDQSFYGIYAAGKTEGGKAGADVYLLGLERDGTPASGEERLTAGVRGFGTCPLTGIELEGEAARQFGDAGSMDIEAWFAAVQAGYTFGNAAGKPRIQLGYDYASGDSDPADDTVGTFHQLFPLGHAYLGYADVLGRQNVTDFSQTFSCWPVPGAVQLRLDHHFFRRADTSDAVYNVGGGVLREGDAGTSSDIGTELDVTLTWKVDRHTVLAAGYSRFFAGDFIEQSGSSEDVEFVYGSAQFTF